MFALIFGLLSLSIVSFYSMFHTISYIKKIYSDLKLKKKYKWFAINIGIFGSVCLIISLYLLSLI